MSFVFLASYSHGSSSPTAATYVIVNVVTTYKTQRLTLPLHLFDSHTCHWLLLNEFFCGDVISENFSLRNTCMSLLVAQL